MIVESAYGTGVGAVFLAAVPLAIVTLIAVVFLPNAPLGTQNAIQRAKVAEAGPAGAEGSADVEDELTRELEDAEDAAIDAAAASVAMAPVGLAHDPSTGAVETVGAGSGANRDAGSRAE